MVTMLFSSRQAFLIALSLLPFFPIQILAQSAPNLLFNGGFEIVNLASPAGWSVDQQVAGKGSAIMSATNVVAGKNSLKLIPNGSNAASARIAAPFGVGQGVSATALRGQQLYVSAWMHADGGANAILRIYVIGTDGTAKMQEILQPASSGAPVLRRDVFQVPDSAATSAVIVLCQVEGLSGTAYFDEVSLSVGVPNTWKEALGVPDPGSSLAATVNVDAGKSIRQIPSTLYGDNLEWVWDGGGLWDVSKAALNSSLLRLTQAAGTTLHRFPGGMFADYYAWQNGVGPLGSRPATNATPQGPFSVHRFGTDEALSFAGQTNGQLLITVNVVTATAADAAAWVRYVNGASRRVLYWEIGNEAYVPGPASLSPETYAARFLQFARAMRAVDPGIKIGAIADENFSLVAPRQYPDWTERVVALAGNQIDFIALHCAYAPALNQDLGWNSRTVYSAMLAAPSMIARHLADLSRRLDALTPSRTTPIQIAITEWGPYFQTDPSGRYVDHLKTLSSALFAASTIKTFVESPRTEIGNFFKLVDPFYMGWIGMRQEVYTAKASLLAVQMFRNYFGPQLVSTATVSPTYDSPAVGWVDAAGQVPYLEVVTSKSSDSKTLYVLGINKHFDRSIRAHIQVQNFAMAGRATVYTLSGTAPDANTGTVLPRIPLVNWAAQAQIGPASRFVNGGPLEVGISNTLLSNLGSDFDFVFEPHSVTSIALEAR